MDENLKSQSQGRPNKASRADTVDEAYSRECGKLELSSVGVVLVLGSRDRVA